jgi:hypothetical protein
MSRPLEETVRALEARVARLEAEEEIRRLKARYGALVDARYGRDGPRPRVEIEPIAAEIAGLFTPDAVWDGGAGLGLCRGRDAIRERFLEPTLRFSWHYFVKPAIEVTGERAHGTWDLLAPCTTQAGVASWMAGVEEDAYARVDGRWLHTAMKLRVVLFAPHAQGWAPARGPRRA